MALRGTATHRKIRRLAKRLGIDACFALGVMESIWHLTAEQQPDGGIGRLSDEDIADEILYSGDPSELIRILLDDGIKFLDSDQECRLYVHDWHEWADDAVIAKLVARRQRFANGEIPRLTKYSKDVREKILADYTAQMPTVRNMRTNADRARNAQNGDGALRGRAHPEPVPVPVPVPVPEPDPAPATAEPPLPRAAPASEFPATFAAVSGFFPDADEGIVMQIVQDSMRAALSLNGESKVEVSDELISDAVRSAWRQDQRSAGLFLQTVPKTVKTWARNGKAPPQPLQRVSGTGIDKKRDAAREAMKNIFPEASNA